MPLDKENKERGLGVGAIIIRDSGQDNGFSYDDGSS